MILKKNWFYHFCIGFATIGLFYIVVCGFHSLGEGQEYPYFPKGILLLGIFAIWMILTLTAQWAVKLNLLLKIHLSVKQTRIIECLFLIVVLGAAVFVRLLVLWNFPMKPASDYKTYYEIAVLLKEGTIQTEGKGYCNYIAMFPHVMGYCTILKMLFSIVGVSVSAGQYLNLFFSVATVYLIYRIGKKIGGKVTGVVAMLLCAFWPSQVLYITMLSAEYCFTFFLFLCIDLFLGLAMKVPTDTKMAAKSIVLHLFLGIMIAITAAIRPMALILLIAIILTIGTQKMKLPAMPQNDIPLPIRILEKGWVRCLLIIVPYMILSNVLTTNIELTVDKTLPSSSTSFGYNLLVGLNTESDGGWNDEDAALLYSSMEETNSASQAHITCRNLAFERLKQNPKGIFNLFIHKYELLWGNDDYGSTWNIAFLKEQGNLTQERSDFLYTIRDWNNIVYIITVFLAIISLIYLWKLKGNYAILLILIFLGTVAMHLMVESQNRYHYFVLQIFMILAGMAFRFLYLDAQNTYVRKHLAKSNETKIQLDESKMIEEMKKNEDKLTELRQEAFSNLFDMQTALQNGNVKMTVSKAYDDPNIDDANKIENIKIVMPDKTEEDMHQSEGEPKS